MSPLADHSSSWQYQGKQHDQHTVVEAGAESTGKTSMDSAPAFISASVQTLQATGAGKLVMLLALILPIAAVICHRTSIHL